jgi:16S rRNA (cytidine1402-2'-O)-methyltransferase
MNGKLILCGTPIGNLEDLSPRAVRALESADVIACEDTRRTRKLLSHFGVRARELVVYHEGNERHKAKDLAGRIARGVTIVLVSDAGMPGLSDPGYRLVAACIEAGIDVEVIPGPSAAVSALAVSGLPPAR